ncbi:biopolymer transporter ExbD [Planctomycetota bacterium]|nr:biopolymer transporter ExbD [Planctomycetota bacterium]
MAKKKGSALREIMNEKCELQMTPMIDVTFLLLIFFMCTLKFKVLEGKLGAYLPKDVGVNTSKAEPVEKVDIRLDVLQPGTKMRQTRDGLVPYTDEDIAANRRFVYSPGTRKIRYTVGTKRTTELPEVVKSLKAFIKADPEKKATIDPRTDINNLDVVLVLDAAMDAGYTDITFKGSFER